MLRVVGAGLPRTGTSSTEQALTRLGFGPSYAMGAIIENPARARHWTGVSSGTTEGWDVRLAGYASTISWPASHFWRELATVYPEAKVVVTVRDPDDWFDSMQALMAYMRQLLTEVQQGLPVAASGQEYSGDRHRDFSRAAAIAMKAALDPIGRTYFGPHWHLGDPLGARADTVRAYENHVARVRAAIAPSRLLVYDVRDGWQPLCRFLRVSVPDEPFPHINSRAGLERG